MAGAPGTGRGGPPVPGSQPVPPGARRVTVPVRCAFPVGGPAVRYPVQKLSRLSRSDIASAIRSIMASEVSSGCMLGSSGE